MYYIQKRKPTSQDPILDGKMIEQFIVALNRDDEKQTVEAIQALKDNWWEMGDWAKKNIFSTLAKMLGHPNIGMTHKRLWKVFLTEYYAFWKAELASKRKNRANNR